MTATTTYPVMEAFATVQGKARTPAPQAGSSALGAVMWDASGAT